MPGSPQGLSPKESGQSALDADSVLGALTTFEHLMLADDRREHPMTFYLRVRGAGALDAERLTAAAAWSLARHPMLAAEPRGTADAKVGGVVWAQRRGKPAIDFAPLGVPVARDGRARGLDMTKDGGVRLIARSGGGRFELWLEFHHAASDAIGGLQFLEDILFAYDAETGTGPVAAPELNPDLLKARGEFHLDPAAKRRQIATDLQRISLYFSQFPEPLPPYAGDTRVPGKKIAVGPTALTIELSATEVAALRQIAHRSGGTVNDLLMRDVFLALDRYAILQGKRRRLRVAMPINMRRPEDQGMPAANVVSMCFLDRSGPALDDAEALLSSIVRETGSIKRNGSGYALIRVAHVAAKTKGGMRFLMTPRAPMRCSASAVLSNLGRPFAGSRLPRDLSGRIVLNHLRLDAVELMPPLREETRLAIGVTQYASKLFLTLHHDVRFLSSAAAGLIASELQKALDASVARAKGRARPFAEILGASRAKRASGPFRSLPIGKNVHYGAAQKLLPETPRA